RLGTESDGALLFTKTSGARTVRTDRSDQAMFHVDGGPAGKELFKRTRSEPDVAAARGRKSVFSEIIRSRSDPLIFHTNCVRFALRHSQ
ncbi:jg22873, partial [Pararge aegeria aegeria]